MSTSNTNSSWFRRHKWLTALIVIAAFGIAGNAGADEAEPRKGGGGKSAQQSAAQVEESQRAQDQEPSVEASPSEDPAAESTARTKKTNPEKTPKPKPTKKPKPAPPAPRTYYVARVIDGDTVELGSGQDVRLVGIDTPEVGQCGYEKAKENLAHLVEGEQVRLTVSDEDTDRYGRLLRYINIGDTDAGLRLIKNGLAIARYDSRDGYGYHRREPIYIATDKAGLLHG